MERLVNEKPSGLSATALRTWGMLFLALGAVGRGILQNRVLGLGGITDQKMLEAVLSGDGAMFIAALSLVLQAVETCAVPIFCLLLVEGFTHTANFTHYLLRVLGTGMACEIPFNLALSGKLLDFDTRNPVIGMALCLIVLYFFKRYAGRSGINTAIKICVTLAAIVWAEMLHIEHGTCCVVLTSVLWAFREKPLYRNMAGCLAGAVCTVISPFYLACPMGFLALHFYRGERGSDNRLVNYLTYPLILLVVWALGVFAAG